MTLLPFRVRPKLVVNMTLLPFRAMPRHFLIVQMNSVETDATESFASTNVCRSGS